MTTIQCRDKFVDQVVIVAFGNDLKTNDAVLKPFKSGNPSTSKSSGATYIMAYSPVVEFDETKTTKEAILKLIQAYGFSERV